MNTTLLTIIVIVSGITAAMQIYNLTQRVRQLEVNLECLMDAIEKAIKMNEEERKKNNNVS